MKIAEGILYIIDGTVKCAERKKPVYPKKTGGFASDYNKDRNYQIDYKSWQESCKDVVNAEMYDAGSEGLISFIVIGKLDYQPVFPQKVLFVPEGDKVRIVELK